VQAELAAHPEIALHLAVPAGQAAGIGEGRPQVVNTGVIAVFDPGDAAAAGRSQAAEDAATRT
jgi:hypothetical protein